MLPRLVRPLVAVWVALGALDAAAQTAPPSTSPPTSSPAISGAWVLNPALTQKPAEIGFSPDWGRAGEPGESSSSGGGGRGHRGGGGGGGGFGGGSRSTGTMQSPDDSTRMQQLTGEARTPPEHITIVQKADSVSIADDQGHSRTFHPDGHLDELTLGTIALPTTARWDGPSLVVTYEVDTARQLRYTFTPADNPKRLLVDVRFLQRGHDGDEVKLTYETPEEHDRAVISGGASAPGLPPPDGPLPTGARAGAPPAAPSAPVGGAPDATAPPARPPALPPGSELRGITTIGTQVEDLTTQAAACGLDQNKIKTSIAKILGDAGFKSQPYGNEESYVLVSVVTSRLSDGVCVSRYDASLMAAADATLPYLKGVVMLEVPLLREGGMTGGSPAQHAAGVMDALTKAVNGFVAQVRGARKP